MISFGFDPGTRFGWSVKYSDGSMKSGVVDLHKFVTRGRKLMILQQWIAESLDNAIKSGESVRVCYENVRRHVGTKAAHVYGAITGLIEMECERRGIKASTVEVSVAKKFATGDGAASKEGMMAEAYRRWGFWPSDDNEADARWICEYVSTEHG